tara:strand:+ start:2397 stop:2642 length:246 start_codon:yes stop_codon:yes gene_type:complete
MIFSNIEIVWPDGIRSFAKEGEEWLIAAKKAGIEIPIGCLGGSCGACEIEVNGKVLRSCINKIKQPKDGKLNVNFAEDPFW